MDTPDFDSLTPQRVVRSFHQRDTRHLSFGDGGPPLPDLDQLARRGNAYDPQVALLLSVISAWAYSDEEVLGRKLRYYGMPGSFIQRVSVRNPGITVGSTAYLIRSASGRSGVLAFRGTDPGNLLNLLTDAQTMPRPFLNGQVHLGFYTATEVIWDDIHAALCDALPNPPADVSATDGERPEHALEHLYLTGHSLGGAVALLAAARLFRPDYATLGLDAGTRVRGIYTFGQPMVGDSAFGRTCEVFGDRLHRHVFRNDPVPRLPPRTKLEYTHVGQERRVHRSDDKTWGEPTEASTALGLLTLPLLLVNAVEARTSSFDKLPGPSIDDHSPLHYMETSRHSVRR